MWKLKGNCVSRCGVHVFWDELTLTKFQTKLRNAGKEADGSVKRDQEQGYEGKGRREGQEKVLFPKILVVLRAPKSCERERRESASQTLVSLPA